MMYSGSLTPADVTAGKLDLAASSSLTADDLAQWCARVSLALPTEEDQALGIFTGPGRNFLLAAVFRTEAAPLFECILLPRKVLQQAAGDLDPFVALAVESFRQEPLPLPARLMPLDVPSLLPWSQAERAAHFQILLAEVGGVFEHALDLLGAALDEHRLLITGYRGGLRQRIDLIQGLMALLPALARAELTFSTCAGSAAGDARIVFADSPLETERWVVDLSAPVWPDFSTVTRRAYLQLLRRWWADDPEALLKALEAVEPAAAALLSDQNFVESLDVIAEQITLDEQVRYGEPVDIEQLKAVLAMNRPLDADLLQQYSVRLLEHTLETRDVEAALLVALRMDESPELDRALQAVLSEHLQTHPDVVYLFVRTRLNDAMELDERWIERLQVAALYSLQVAISAGDPETIMNWLRLIAREPSSYGLAAILREGLLAAQARAYADGDLARFLIMLAIKHAPDTLDNLLANNDLLAVLPNNLGLVLRDHAGDPLYTLQHRGPEMFLVAMARSARARAAGAFNEAVIDALWKIYASGQVFNLPEHYQPDEIIDTLVSTGPKWLPPALREHLATVMLADGRDELFLMFAVQLAKVDALLPLLANALQNSQRSVDDLIAILNQLVASGRLTLQAVADVYVDLLERREWRQAALPLVEQLARLIQQHPELNIDNAVIWQLIEVALVARAEMIARAAVQQLTRTMQTAYANSSNPETAESQLIDTLLRLYEAVSWNVNARSYLLKWWREFVLRQPLVRLARLDKALENKKALVDYRTVVQSSLAFRRMLGNRSMSEFAEAVNTVYSILADISESFDPSPRQPATFDEETIRSELNTRREELSEHQWHILAKNLKELAGLIGLMGDQRSRSSLVRQNVDRQLLAGEQQPESAVDAMKWMSGYMDGIQGRGDAAE
jgi:hypothetical protein